MAGARDYTGVFLKSLLLLFILFVPISHTCVICLSTALCRKSWEELLEMIRLRGERLKDAEAIYKSYQDLTDALTHIEVKTMVKKT